MKRYRYTKEPKPLEIRVYEITTKEIGRDKPITTRHTGSQREKFLIDFFGLEKPDVEWYTIKRLR